MEEWAFVDERELQGWKGGCVCITCQHFTYGVDQHCRVQPQATTVATRRTPEEEVQALGADVAEGSELGS